MTEIYFLAGFFAALFFHREHKNNVPVYLIIISPLSKGQVKFPSC